MNGTYLIEQQPKVSVKPSHRRTLHVQFIDHRALIGEDPEPHVAKINTFDDF